MPGGRPTSYSAKVTDKICERITQGDSVKTIAKEDWCPEEATVYRWLAKHPEFREQYTRAREMQTERMLEEIIEISDDSSLDIGFKEDGEGGAIPFVNHENIQRSKLRVDTRKWAMGKLAPKKYGDKTQTEITPGEGVTSFTLSINGSSEDAKD